MVIANHHARGQLNRENKNFSVQSTPENLAREKGSAVPSAPAHFFSTLRLNLILTHGLLSSLPVSATASIFTASRPPGQSVLSLSGQASACRWCSPPKVHWWHRESVILKIARVTRATFSGSIPDGPTNARLSFSTPTCRARRLLIDEPERISTLSQPY